MAVRGRAAVLAVLVAGLLAGCGNTPDDGIEQGLLQKVKALVPARGGAAAGSVAAQDPEALRASLASVGVPVLRVRLPAIGADTFITPRDTNSGTESWLTADGSVFTFRDGVLIETRGVISDLMSAAAPSAGQIRAGSGSYRRSYYVLGEEDKTARIDLDCSLAVIGAETVEILGRTHATRHVQERCTGPGRTVTNDYWIDAGGAFRKSSQWANDRLGQAEFSRVID